MIQSQVARGRGFAFGFVVVGLLVASTLVLLGQRLGDNPASVERHVPAAAVDPGDESGAPAAQAPSTQIQRAVAWVNGLESGLILPTDVSVRLQSQKPHLAKTVLTAWSALSSSPPGA